MAPTTPQKEAQKDTPYIHAINRTPEYEEFIKKLTAFHDNRGTTFEPEPRLPTQYGHVYIDLLQLYRKVIEKGGYDELNKVQKAWGGVAEELGMHYSDPKGQGQLSFQLKQDFYKYLAAFWIHDHYGKEPPPKEILEHQSCASKYGPVLTRTAENFKLATKSSGEQTPVREERSVENTPVSGTRSSGRLREAPPQRVPFQPDTGPSRQTRHSSSHVSTPSGGASHPSQYQGYQHPSAGQPQHYQQPPPQVMRGPSSSFVPPNSETAARLSDAYEPRAPIVVPLRPVNTPGNNPVEFAKRQRQLRQSGREEQYASRALVPGGGSDGPSIYIRCLQSLRSAIPEEQAFALYHLVKISVERGDKFKFDSFPGLDIGLMEKALEIGSLFYDVDWELSYAVDSATSTIATLDAANGTSDIISRIQKLSPKPILDGVQSAEFSDKLVRITEATLTLRNMIMLPDNAYLMSDVPLLKDLLCIILHLPNLEILVEIKHFALDIAEQVTPFMVLEANDPLYVTLLSQLDSTDRGTILTALRSISRISMNLEATNKLQNVPPKALQHITEWLLLNDEELMDACLDFLYQYTAVVPNIESLLKSIELEHLVPHLVRLLAHGAKRVKEERELNQEVRAPASEEVAPVPPEIHEKLVNTEEPQRCFNWLQTLFEEDPKSHITQIAIWQAYQTSFGALAAAGRHVLSAADFIRNVSHVFTGARAQIIRGHGEAQKFIIEGIRARTLPVDYESKEEFSRCLWLIQKSPPRICARLHLGAESMWKHVLKTHLGVQTAESGQFENKEMDLACSWGMCRKDPQPSKQKLAVFSKHLKTHLVGPSKRSAVDSSSDQAAKRQRKTYIVPAKTMNLTWEQTLTTRDERTGAHSAAGIPLSAVLVLRNIARNIVKTEAEEKLQQEAEEGGETGGWNEKLFRPVLPRLFEVLTENKALAVYVSSLLQLVQEDRS